MALAHCSCDLNGIRLRVEAEDAPLAAFLDAVCLPFRVEDDGEPPWRIRLAHQAETEPPPADAILVWQGLLLGGPEVTVLASATADHMLSAGGFAVRADRRDREVEIALAAKPRLLPEGVGTWVLERILAAEGRHLLHGATLVDPATDRALAIFAPSGTGKSTTALALARAGLLIGGDDALVLETGPGRTRIWPLPRKVKVQQRTAAMLPWLQEAIGEWEADEQAVGLTRLAGMVGVAAPRPRPAATVVVLRRANESGHLCRRIAASEALTAILTDNVFVGPRGVGADGRAAFAALGNLLAGAACLELSVGPDPGTLTPAAILSAGQSDERTNR
jgi:hypothetical protein